MRPLLPLQVYTGTYLSDSSNSVYLYQFNPATGALAETGREGAGPKPSFLALHPNGRYLYAVNETSGFMGTPGGGVSAMAVDPVSGSLSLINQQPSHGTDPCHLVVDRTGRWLFAANYSSGTLAVYPIRNDGSLGEATQVIQHEGHGLNPEQQAGPHAHAVYTTPDNRYLLACDLGLDQVIIYRLDAEKGRLIPHRTVSLHPGAGPRHLAFHPNGKYIYTINELDATLTAYQFDAETAALVEMQTLTTLERDHPGVKTAAEIAVHPSGRFVYASNRGPDNNLAIFAVDETTGKLSLVGYEPTRGQTPRSFAISPGGKYLLAAHQDSGEIVTFEIDPETGGLSFVSQVQAETPVCVIFWQPGK